MASHCHLRCSSCRATVELQKAHRLNEAVVMETRDFWNTLSKNCYQVFTLCDEDHRNMVSVTQTIVPSLSMWREHSSSFQMTFHPNYKPRPPLMETKRTCTLPKFKNYGFYFGQKYIVKAFCVREAGNDHKAPPGTGQWCHSGVLKGSQQRRFLSIRQLSERTEVFIMINPKSAKRFRPALYVTY